MVNQHGARPCDLAPPSPPGPRSHTECCGEARVKTEAYLVRAMPIN